MPDHDGATSALTRALAHSAREAYYRPAALRKSEQDEDEWWRQFAGEVAQRLAESGHGIAPLSVIEADEALSAVPDLHGTSLEVTRYSEGWEATVEWWGEAGGRLVLKHGSGKAATLPEAVRAALGEAPDHGCPVPSSITGQPCLLPAGHPQDSPARFHRYEAPR